MVTENIYTLFLIIANIFEFLRAMCQARVQHGACFVHAGCCYENIWEILNLNDSAGEVGVRGGGMTGTIHSINSYCAYLSLIRFSH